MIPGLSLKKQLLVKTVRRCNSEDAASQYKEWLLDFYGEHAFDFGSSS